MTNTRSSTKAGRALALVLMATISTQATACSVLAKRHRIMGAAGDTLMGLGGLIVLSSAGQSCGGLGCTAVAQGAAAGGGLFVVGALVGGIAFIASEASRTYVSSPTLEPVSITPLPPRAPVIAHPTDPAQTHLAALAQAAAITGRCEVASTLIKRLERRDRVYAYRVRDAGALAPCE